jgi:hypothetical protein
MVWYSIQNSLFILRIHTLEQVMDPSIGFGTLRAYPWHHVSGNLVRFGSSVLPPGPPIFYSVAYFRRVLDEPVPLKTTPMHLDGSGCLAPVWKLCQ